MFELLALTVLGVGLFGTGCDSVRVAVKFTRNRAQTASESVRFYHAVIRRADFSAQFGREVSRLLTAIVTAVLAMLFDVLSRCSSAFEIAYPTHRGSVSITLEPSGKFVGAISALVFETTRGDLNSIQRLTGRARNSVLVGVCLRLVAADAGCVAHGLSPGLPVRFPCG
jgi:hypothetical protein